MDVSPRKKPAFSLRKATRTSTPEEDDDYGDNFGAVNAPLGVSLLLQSVYTGVVITTVTLAQTDDYRQASFSQCGPALDVDATPRFDLLETWLAALRNDRPELGDTGFKKDKGDKSSCPALEKVKTALTARGILVTASCSLPTGSHIGLADHRHVDDILAAGAISAPALSPNPIPVMRCRQIEIEHCFELVVSGLSEGEGVQLSLCRWLTRNFRDAATKDSFLVDARVDSYERNCLVFYMSDWASTTRVLVAGEKLVSEFRGDSPSIHRPQLLLAFNNNGVWRPKSLSQTFQDGASSVNNAIASLRAEVHELKRETRTLFESNQLAISAVSKSVSTLHSTVDSLHTRLSNHASAFLIQSAEQATRAQLVQVQMVMAQHQNTMRFGYADHYAESAGQAIAMLGGTLCSSITPPVNPPGIEIHSRSPSSSPENAKEKRKSSNVQDDDSLKTDKPAASSIHNPSSLLLLLLILLSAASLALVAGPRANPGFSSYALNMNGLGGPGKISHINSAISQRNPHSFVITETKTNEKLSSKLPREYNIFEEDALPLPHGKGHKWGVASIAKGGESLRVIGVYAPWDPGINNIDPNAREFWGDLTSFCNETQTSWSISGDLNATVTSSERAADKSIRKNLPV
ncbi:hypothetical protein MVEN_02180700 [Mycena venus]|uniref:Uncharacterized protein n=1 Tax=Mycena venus TaxID=2733690 RepID=A0A8H6X8C5_9AGAR|nr:hypothetical protein MVEN_02180700 [Mycena venus]